ncbi:hypothetical protein [Methylobacterium nodulans]|uniref:Uncharacterized protein n=1 Tax=Methylobacterium nodulans (strain LMG 21967 / CNCM I-2342 / ORS 2060) TaxID=460265 RepID=B8ID36_METNO|nr:hypothetical protein [Methylobacterium nodulans]ACL59428.1 conserved hypothetical protein [Methylobacterium nodulans ORS 2060]
MSDASLFLNLAGAMAIVAAAGHGIRLALDAWIRLAPAGTPDDPAGE